MDLEKRKAYHREYYKTWKVKRFEQGLCVNCSNPRLPDRRQCLACITKQKGRALKADLAAIEAKKCRQCHIEPIENQQRLCDKCREKSKHRYWRDKEAYKQKVQEYVDTLREGVFAHYGDHCACCGESNKKLLTIDHMNNDGKTHRQTIGHTSEALMRWLRDNNYPEGFQILCWNCNVGKKMNGGICPHKEV